MIRLKANRIIKKSILLFCFIISATCYSQKILPFSIDSDEFVRYEKAILFLKKGNYKEAAFFYNKSKKVITYFPNEQYKLAIAL